MIIYCLLNLVNQKKYIGQTSKNLSLRWSQHVYDAKNETTNCLIHKAMRKYGKENFVFFELCKVNDLIEANKMEILFIKIFRPQYNLSPGGATARSKGWKLSEEACKKMSEARKSKKLSEHHRKAISEGHKGLKLSDTARRALSGRKFSDAHRLALSKAHKGIKLSISHRQAISEGNTGKKVSEETRRKISESERRTKNLIKATKSTYSGTIAQEI